jgi:hypothetical protein
VATIVALHASQNKAVIILISNYRALLFINLLNLQNPYPVFTMITGQRMSSTNSAKECSSLTFSEAEPKTTRKKKIQDFDKENHRRELIDR